MYSFISGIHVNAVMKIETFSSRTTSNVDIDICGKLSPDNNGFINLLVLYLRMSEIAFKN